jgi:nucleotide-binding universal stress UspA family protein
MNARQESVHPEISSTARYRRILVATDGSDCSTLAATHAVYLAETLGARLYALYSVDVQRAFHVGIHFGEGVVELEKFGHEAVGAVRVLAEERGLACEEIVAEGTPHRSIIRASDEIGADLIVLGSTGMTSLERALIGSESQKVLLYSERPVLLVREP